MLTIKIPSIYAPTLKETRKESWSNRANDSSFRKFGISHHIRIICSLIIDDLIVVT